MGFLRRGLPHPPAKGLERAVSWISSGHFSKFSDVFLFVKFFSELSGGVYSLASVTDLLKKNARHYNLVE